MCVSNTDTVLDHLDAAVVNSRRYYVAHSSSLGMQSSSLVMTAYESWHLLSILDDLDDLLGPFAR